MSKRKRQNMIIRRKLEEKQRRAGKAALILPVRDKPKGRRIPTIALAAALATGCVVTEPTIWATHAPMDEGSDVAYKKDTGVGISGNVWESKGGRNSIRLNADYFESGIKDPIADVHSRRFTTGIDFIRRTGRPAERLNPDQKVMVTGLYFAEAEIVKAQEDLEVAKQLYRKDLEKIIGYKRHLVIGSSVIGKEGIEKAIEDATTKSMENLSRVVEASKKLSEAQSRQSDLYGEVVSAELEGTRIPEKPSNRTGFAGYATIGLRYLDNRVTVDYSSTHELHKESGIGARAGLGVRIGPLNAEVGATYPLKENGKKRKVRFGGKIGWRF